MFYKPFQIARYSGRVHIVTVTKSGRLDKTLASVIEGFEPPNLSLVIKFLSQGEVTRAIKALNNEPLP